MTLYILLPVLFGYGTKSLCNPRCIALTLQRLRQIIPVRLLKPKPYRLCGWIHYRQSILFQRNRLLLLYRRRPYTDKDSGCYHPTIDKQHAGNRLCLQLDFIPMSNLTCRNSRYRTTVSLAHCNLVAI